MCQNCPKKRTEWNKDWVELRFIGGRDKDREQRGPYLSFETNKIYLVPPRHEQYPYWEAVDKKKKEKKKKKSKPKPPEVIEEKIEPEIIDEEPKQEIEPPSKGLTKKFGGTPPTHEDFIKGMDVKTLRNYIRGQLGKVDMRWGKTKLIEEALKIQ